MGTFSNDLNSCSRTRDEYLQEQQHEAEIKSLNKDNYEVDFDMNNYEEILNAVQKFCPSATNRCLSLV